MVQFTKHEVLFSSQCSEDRIAKEKRFISHQIVEACALSQASMNLKEGMRNENQDYEEAEGEDLRERSYAQRFENDNSNDDARNIRSVFPSSDFRFADE